MNRSSRLAEKNAGKLAAGIAKAALEKNAQNVTVLDLTGLDTVTDYFVICTGEVNMQVRAIVNHVEKEMRKLLRERAVHREGYESLNWVLLDYVDVVVHVFRPSFREYYRLEELWGDAERIDIESDTDLKKIASSVKKKGCAQKSAQDKANSSAVKQRFMKRAHTHLDQQLRVVLCSLGITEPTVILEKPRDPEHGDIATNAAMVHCKQLKLPPRKLAEQLTKELELDPSLVKLEGVAGPGFINFRFAEAYLQSLVKQINDEGDLYGKGCDYEGKKVQIEFISANPSGPLNVVSARAAAVGDTLVRMFRERGAQSDAEFYVNDAGNQVKLLGESLLARYHTLLGYETEIPEGGYHGEYIIEFAKQLVEEHGDKFSTLDTEEAAEQLGRMAVERHVGMQRASLKRFRVEMDHWFRESKLRDSRAEYAALEELKRQGNLYEKDGAVFLKTSEFGDTQDWVVMTSEGRPTYFLPDIAYHLSKFDRGYDVMIDILGPDHHSYLTKMAAAMRALGRDADKLEIMLLQHITLSRNGEPVKMSKRAGQMIEMDELLDEVGSDAARYFFLLRRTTTPLDFDIELAKKQSDDNPVFYVQYAHARISSIFRKAEIDLDFEKADFVLLTHPEEYALLRRLREFDEVIGECVKNRDPHGMTVWLRELAAQFHRFYHHCRVITEPEELSLARLALCRATQIGLRRGLELCGVNAPEEM